ncbi:hypothetical protein FOS14_23035 [Skermania sp. ID1734]|uniref:hypothetical protein n=1 Tax=Skermania sp. ID1734 TaxID=2597516 RepID=UPI001180F1C4|nr:hypothetical protein [Skermania sp. ID1734]TSD93430.1 hypothetical protein FOS14_23035 [Skermania sp. ID1734]
MRSRSAWALGGFFMFDETILAASTWGDATRHWPIVAALLSIVIAGVLILVVRSDPMPLPAAVAVALCGPVGCALAYSVLSVPSSAAAESWPSAAGTVCAAFLCVRGRVLAGWVGVLSMVGLAAWWGSRTGAGALAASLPQLVNVATILMATVFAFTIRPAARLIFELEDEATRRIAAESAAAATLAERNRQMHRLDHLVRPILTTIAETESLQPHQRRECRLLEAQLRDSLRGAALAVPDVSAAARSAREKGVEVVLVDDHGLDDVRAAEKQRILDRVAAEIRDTEVGSVLVRILPPNRSALATILVKNAGGIRRLEL